MHTSSDSIGFSNDSLGRLALEFVDTSNVGRCPRRGLVRLGSLERLRTAACSGRCAGSEFLVRVPCKLSRWLARLGGLAGIRYAPNNSCSCGSNRSRKRSKYTCCCSCVQFSRSPGSNSRQLFMKGTMFVSRLARAPKRRCNGF